MTAKRRSFATVESRWEIARLPRMCAYACNTLIARGDVVLLVRRYGSELSCCRACAKTFRRQAPSRSLLSRSGWLLRKARQSGDAADDPKANQLPEGDR